MAASLSSQLFPFKLSVNLDIFQVLKRHIIINFGGESTFNQVSSAVTEMGALRQSLDYASLASKVDSNIETADQIEQSVIKYLRYAYLLDKTFTFESQPSSSSSLSLPFPWSDSFNQKSMCDISNMKYELQGHLFNLAVNEYNRGSKLILNGSTERDRKIGVAKLRVGIWASEEVKKFLPQVSLNGVKSAPTDLYMNYINVISNFCSGTACFGNFLAMEPNESAIGVVNLCSLLHEGAKHFRQVTEILANDKNLKIPQEFKKRLSNESFLSYAVLESIALMKYCTYQVSLIPDDPLGGHMGLALSYALVGERLSAEVKKLSSELKSLNSLMKEKLIETGNFFSSNVPVYKQKNDAVYKHKVFSGTEIPEIPALDPRLQATGSEPSALGQKLECEDVFQTFCSPELINMMKEYKDFGNKRLKELEDSLKILIEKKNKAYLENYVNYLVDLDLGKVGALTLPQALKDRHQDFIKRGGKDQLFNLMTTLKETSVNCGMMIANIKESIQREKMEDMNMKAVFQAKWNRQPSDNLNKDYIKAVNDFNDKFNVAQQVDQGIKSKYESNLHFIEIFSKPENEIVKSLPSNSDSDFVENNMQKIKQLKALNTGINQSIEGLRECANKVKNFLGSANFAKDIVAAKQKNLTKEQGIEAALAPVAEIINEYNNKLDELQINIANIVTDAVTLNSSKKGGFGGGGKAMDEFSNATSRIIEIFHEIDQGLKFYQNWTILLIDLDKRISDFVMAREMEKQNMIQILSNSGNQQGGGQWNPYNFK